MSARSTTRSCTRELPPGEARSLDHSRGRDRPGDRAATLETRLRGRLVAGQDRPSTLPVISDAPPMGRPQFEQIGLMDVLVRSGERIVNHHVFSCVIDEHAEMPVARIQMRAMVEDGPQPPLLAPLQDAEWIFRARRSR